MFGYWQSNVHKGVEENASMSQKQASGQQWCNRPGQQSVQMSRWTKGVRRKDPVGKTGVIMWDND
jgi:hypothetical protein